MKGFASLMANLLGAPAICGRAPVAKDIQISGRNQQLLGLLKTLDPQKGFPPGDRSAGDFSLQRNFRSKVSYPQERTDDQRRSSVPL
jgi:hypothetical protein